MSQKLKSTGQPVKIFYSKMLLIFFSNFAHKSVVQVACVIQNLKVSLVSISLDLEMGTEFNWRQHAYDYG